jgi:hypothetical protein
MLHLFDLVTGGLLALQPSFIIASWCESGNVVGVFIILLVRWLVL